MSLDERPRVLCVDDEPSVLESLSLHLRRRYHVDTAESGAAALELLRRDDASTAVIVSDMRMPRMDGVAFLGEARRVAPLAVRVLLTGHADLDSAVAAVNEGQLFRFLTKPCPPPAFVATVDAAAAQHRLVIAERVLLEETLRGSVKTLTDLLALTSPLAFGRATRLRRRVSEAATRLELAEPWQVEMAAMLSQLGAVTLPHETLERVYYGLDLTPPEREQVARLPAVAEQLLASIPRLETVRAIIARAARRERLEEDPAPVELAVHVAAQLLAAAAHLDALEARGHAAWQSRELLRARDPRCAPEILDALCAGPAQGDGSSELRELPIDGLQVGMVLAEDVKLPSGVLLVARGFEVTPALIERIRGFRAVVKAPVRVTVARATTAAGAGAARARQA